jgi:hypothetical protein
MLVALRYNLVPAQQYVGQFLGMFKEFSPRQKTGSFGNQTPSGGHTHEMLCREDTELRRRARHSGGIDARHCRPGRRAGGRAAGRHAQGRREDVEAERARSPKEGHVQGLRGRALPGIALEGRRGAILASDQAKAIRLHFLRDLTKGQLIEAFQEGFEANAKDKAAQKAAFDKMLALVPDVKAGSTLTFTCLGSKPASEDLKKGMLG